MTDREMLEATRIEYEENWLRIVSCRKQTNEHKKLLSKEKDIIKRQHKLMSKCGILWGDPCTHETCLKKCSSYMFKGAKTLFNGKRCPHILKIKSEIRLDYEKAIAGYLTSSNA